MTDITGKRTGHSIALALLLVSLFLSSCNGDDDRAFINPPVNQIAVGAPVDDTVVQGGFNAYAVSAAQGTVYKISLTSVTDDADLLYFGTDNTFGSPAACAADNTALEGITAEDCIAAAAGGTLYFAVDGAFVSTANSAYTIAVEQVVTSNINLSVPVPDSINRRQAILYTLPAPAAGAYLAAITGLNEDADLLVFEDSLGTPAVCTPDNTMYTGSTPEDCRLGSSQGDVLLLVDGIFSSSSTVRYTAFITPSPAVASPGNEGLADAPVALAVDTLRTGQAGFEGAGFYSVSGVSAGSRYTVGINGLSAGANLSVYNSDSTYSSTPDCVIDNIFYESTTPESCTVTAAGTSLYFTVSADTSSGGVAFITLVEPGP